MTDDDALTLTPQPRSVCHHFPMRPGYLAQVVLPADLTTAEAKRLQDFLMSLVIPAKEPR
jgi:hypothetical protein